MTLNYIPPKTIISGSPGIGKTTASLKYDNVIDLESSQFFFNTPDDMTLKDYEQLKGDTSREPNPNALEDYVKAIIEAHKTYDYVLIAMFPELLKRLHQEGLDVQLVFPQTKDKINYKKRYQKRGNRDVWIDKIMLNWENYIDVGIKNNIFTKEPIILESENLSDIISGNPHKTEKDSDSLLMNRPNNK